MHGVGRLNPRQTSFISRTAIVCYFFLVLDVVDPSFSALSCSEDFVGGIWPRLLGVKFAEYSAEPVW